MVPTQLHRLMLLPEADAAPLRRVVAAARDARRRAVPGRAEAQALDWCGPVIYEYYGASEGGGTMVRAAEWLERPGTVGRPWPGAGVRVLDDDGKDLPPARSAPCT